MKITLGSAGLFHHFENVLFSASQAIAAEMKLAVTTSFHNSGLSETLLPAIKQDLDLDVHLVVVGTGQALRLGAAGDVDGVLVHSKKAEEDSSPEEAATSAWIQDSSGAADGGGESLRNLVERASR